MLDIVHCLRYILYTRRFGSWLYSSLQVSSCYDTENNKILTVKMCQYYDNQLPEDGSRVNSRNADYITYTLDNEQCPTQCIYNDKNWFCWR
jgi:hypothetical protein